MGRWRGNVYEWDGYKSGKTEKMEGVRGAKNVEKTAEGRKKGKGIAGAADVGGKGEV